MSDTAHRVGLALAATLVTIGAAPGVAAAEPTFTRDVVPILQAHCQECHRPSGAAPFELAVYDHVYRRRDKIAEVVRARTMPPWKPVAGYGEFVGVRGLSKDEIATILRWVEGGAPEVVPGNRRIVHHVLAMVDEAGDSARIPSGDADPGYPCFGGPKVKIGGYLGGWTPGSRPWVMPEGVGIRLPPGARVVVQMHYHNARLAPETDQTELRLHAATAPVAKRLQFMRVGQFGLRIEMMAAWDNSADNPRNPNRPPKRVYWGERTVDEMGHAAVLFTYDDESPPAATTPSR